MILHMFKVFILIFFLNFFYQFSFATKKELECIFPSKSEQMILNNCAVKNADGSFEFLKSARKKFIFDSNGLTGGFVLNEGCFWMNKKGLSRKTYCFDNGADYFKEGLTRYIDSHHKFGFMNQKLKIVIPAKYTFAFPFDGGSSTVCNHCLRTKIKDSEYTTVTGGDWMIINKQGEVIKKCPTAKTVTECR